MIPFVDLIEPHDAFLLDAFGVFWGSVHPMFPAQRAIFQEVNYRQVDSLADADFIEQNGLLNSKLL